MVLFSGHTVVPQTHSIVSSIHCYFEFLYRFSMMLITNLVLSYVYANIYANKPQNHQNLKIIRIFRSLRNLNYPLNAQKPQYRLVCTNLHKRKITSVLWSASWKAYTELILTQYIIGLNLWGTIKCSHIMQIYEKFWGY